MAAATVPSVVAVLASLSLGGAARAQGNALVRTGKHFAVHCHMEQLFTPLAEGLAAEALATAERAWPVLDRFGLARGGPPSEIHLHADAKSFRAVEKSQSNHAFLVEAFVNVGATQSHVLMWPQLPAEILQRVGLTQGTRQDIVRVAAEQAVTQLLADGGSDSWLREVLVMGVVEEVFNPQHECEVDAGYDERREQVVALLRESSPPTLRSSLEWERPAKERGYWEAHLTWAAVAAQQFDAIADGWARKLVAKARATKKGIGTHKFREAVAEAVLGSDWEKTEARFLRLVQTMRPGWRISAPYVEVTKGRLRLIGSEETGAIVTAAEPVPKGPYAVSAKALLDGGDVKGEFRVRLGCDEHSLVGVFFGPAWYCIAEFDLGARKWTNRAEGQAAIPVDKVFVFRIEVTATHVRASVDGKEVGAWAYGSRSMNTNCTFETGARFVTLEDVRIEPLLPAKK